MKKSIIVVVNVPLQLCICHCQKSGNILSLKYDIFRKTHKRKSIILCAECNAYYSDQHLFVLNKYCLNDVELDQINRVKDIGIYIDSALSFKGHYIYK